MLKIIWCCALTLVGGLAHALATATFTLTPSDEQGNPYGLPVVVFADGLAPPVIPLAPPWIVPAPANAPVYGMDIAPALAPGQVADMYWAYSITLTVDGFPATRENAGCIRWYAQPICAPQATGSELAFAGVGIVPERRVSGGQSSFISASETPRFVISGEDGDAERFTQTGVMHLQFTGLPSEISRPTSYSVFAWVWVDSNPSGPISPVPEPATYFLMASGLMLVAVQKRRIKTARR
jgi:PEP-CTERM motif